MSSHFLVQLNGAIGYPMAIEKHVYSNPNWMERSWDKAHGDVNRGDVIIFYCTSGVPTYGSSIALQATVDNVSSDHADIHLRDLHFFREPLAYKTIRQMLELGTIDETFRSCGAQGFDIKQLEPQSVEQVLKLLGEDTTSL